jgi:hypothetical protein
MPDHRTLRDASDTYNNNKRVVDSYKDNVRNLADARKRTLE